MLYIHDNVISGIYDKGWNFQVQNRILLTRLKRDNRGTSFQHAHTLNPFLQRQRTHAEHAEHADRRTRLHAHAAAALSRARADFDAMGGENYRDETVKAMEGARDLTRAREHALECAREKETDGETKKTSEKESDPCCDSKRNSQTREKERKAIEPSHKIFSQPTIENEVDDAREKSRKEEKARWAHASGVAHLTAREITPPPPPPPPKTYFPLLFVTFFFP